MTNEEAKVFLDNLKICINEHPIVADWLVEIENRNDEPSNSEIPNSSTISKMEQVDKDINVRSKDEPQTDIHDLTDCDFCKDRNCKDCEGGKDEPQTETEIAKAIVHKMIDDAVIAEDAYPDLRQKMHDAVDEYEPQTEEPTMDEYYKDHDEFYDCDRYVITNDEGERAYNCIGCEQTDCAWRYGDADTEAGNY